MSNPETTLQLTKFLKKIFGVIDDYSINIEDINQGQGDGYTTQMIYVTLSHKNSGKNIHLAIKHPRLNEDGTFSQYTDTHFEREIHFYQIIWPFLKKYYEEVAKKEVDFVPTCYGVSTGTIKKIALENQKKNGYVSFDRTKSLDDEHIRKLFDTYGIFHGISMALKIKNIAEYRKLTNGIGNRWQTVLTDGKYLAELIKALASDSKQYFDPLTEGIAIEKLEMISKIGPKLVRESFTDHEANAVILHGDCWSNNILWKYHVSIHFQDSPTVFQFFQQIHKRFLSFPENLLIFDNSK